MDSALKFQSALSHTGKEQADMQQRGGVTLHWKEKDSTNMIYPFPLLLLLLSPVNSKCLHTSLFTCALHKLICIPGRRPSGMRWPFLWARDLNQEDVWTDMGTISRAKEWSITKSWSIQEQETHGFVPAVFGGGDRSTERWEKDYEPSRKREDPAQSLHRKPGGGCVGNWAAVCPLIAGHTGIWATLKWKGKVQPQQGATQVFWQWKSMSLIYKLK